MTDQKELIPMMPGDILRHERIKKGLTLERAAAQSRISAAVLEAIETSQTGDIPSVYLRGHIKHYALYLGVNPQQLDQHMEHVTGVEPVVRSVFEIKLYAVFSCQILPAKRLGRTDFLRSTMLLHQF